MPDQSTRARITRAAFDLFVERGYDATTVEAIAERAGVGRTTFFRMFGTKEEVVFPDHPSLLAQVEARLAASTPEARDLALTEAARLVLLHYLAEGDLARTRYRLTSTVPALRAREVAGIGQYQRLFRRHLRRWLGPGTDPDLDLEAELRAAAVVTAHNHVLRRWLRGDATEPLAELEGAMRRALAPDASRAAGSGGPASVDTGSVDTGSVDTDGGGTTVVVLRSPAGLDVVLPRLRAALDDATSTTGQPG